jgi:hypothetical protein
MLRFGFVRSAMLIAMLGTLAIAGPACEGCDGTGGVGVGSECGGETPCQDNLVCVDGVCAEGGSVGVGGDCSADEDCATLSCSADGACAPGEVPVGDSCTANQQCESNNCGPDGNCVDGEVGVGGECVAGDQCASGECVSGECTDPGGEGEGEGEGDGGTTGDGGTGDAGDPLGQNLDDFCAGTGSPVLVGSGDACAGDIAENTFQFALCSCTRTQLGGRLDIDSFNSLDGPYGDSNIGSDGQFGTNGPFADGKTMNVRGSMFIGGGDLQSGASSLVEGALYVYGSATAQANTSLTVGLDAFIKDDSTSDYSVGGGYFTEVDDANDQAVVTGATAEVNPFPEVLPCACEEDEKLDIAELTSFGADNNDNGNMVYVDGGVLDGGEVVDGGTATAVDSTQYEDKYGPTDLVLPCGRYYLTRITPPSGTDNADTNQSLRIVAEGRVVLFIDGDMAIAGLDIEVADGAEIDLFVNGTLSVKSAAQFGDESQPASVRTYVNGNLVMGASSRFAGNVYAPNATVAFNGSSEIFGSLFVDTVNFGAAASIHFDSAIRQAGDVCVEPAPDAGPTPDAGVPLDDAGNPIDAGVTPPQDAGVPVDDAGNPIDAGVTPPQDAGVTPPQDSGPAPPECTDICDTIGCADGEACLSLPAGGYGQCGACTTSLDCCAPNICIGGQCILFGG